MTAYLLRYIDSLPPSTQNTATNASLNPDQSLSILLPNEKKEGERKKEKRDERTKGQKKKENGITDESLSLLVAPSVNPTPEGTN